MADIKVRGYVNRPETKTGASGKPFHRFSLAESVKQKDGSRKSTYYDVTMFDGELPEESSYVTVDGRFTVKEWEKEGKKRTYLEILANNISLFKKDSVNTAAATTKDPWEV